MKKLRPISMLLFGSIAVLGLAGCEQVEQAANDTLENARQSAVQVLEDARQSGSIDQARQSASEALNQARQKASGLLGEASEYLGDVPQVQKPESQAEDPPPAL